MPSPSGPSRQGQAGREPSSGPGDSSGGSGDSSGGSAGSETILHPLMGFTSKTRGAPLPCCPHCTSVRHEQPTRFQNVPAKLLLLSNFPSALQSASEALHRLRGGVSSVQDMEHPSPIAPCPRPQTDSARHACPTPQVRNQQSTGTLFPAPFLEVLEERLFSAPAWGGGGVWVCHPPSPVPACLYALTGDKLKPAFCIAPW